MEKARDFSGAYTGLEGAIVLIAFVIVAAVFSYDVISAGFYTTQKTRETVFMSVEQSTANIRLMGRVYGLSDDVSKGINEIRFCVGLEPGAPEIDLTRMKIIISTPATAPVILTHTAAAAVVKDVDTLESDPQIQPVTRSSTSKIPPKSPINVTPENVTITESYAHTFSTKINGVTLVNTMDQGQQVEIDFLTDYISANTRITIEMRPAVGASLLLGTTAPATITPTNILN